MRININKPKNADKKSGKDKKKKRRRSSEKSPKANMIAGFVVMLFGLGFLAISWNLLSSYRAFRANSVQATGVVTEVTNGRGEAEGLTVRIDGTDGAEPLFVNVGQYGGGYDEGDEVDVLYKEGNPQSAGLANAFGPWITLGIFGLIGGTAFLMGGMLILQTMARKS